MVPASATATVETLPLPPIRAGYVFHNWNTRANGSGAVFCETTVITANTTVYAQWLDDISPAIIAITSSHTYTGTAQEAEFTVTHNGNELIEGADFTIAYIDNVNAGEDTALITITGVAENGYGGTATASFTITKKPITASGAPLSKVYDGTASAPPGEVTFTGLAESDTLVVDIDYEITHAGFIGSAITTAGTNKTYLYVIGMLDTLTANNYHLSSGSLTGSGGVIYKADPEVTWPTGLTAAYGQALSNIVLPDNGTSDPAGLFAWVTPTALVGDAGTQSHNMTFTPTDTTNYNTMTQDVNLMVRLVEMVQIDGGTFRMGSPSTETGHNNIENYRTENDGYVTVSGYWMGKYQVTQAQYRAVMGNNPSWFRAGGLGASLVTGLNTDPFPVETVSWYDAIVFCNRLSILEGLSPAYRIPGYGNSDDPEFWIASNGGTIPVSNNATWNAVQIVPGSTGYRLPTEAQWEYACRAGTTTAYNTGSNTINTSQANYNSFLNRTSAVGSYTPNAFGLYDIHGNVWEWCWDWYNASYTTTQEEMWTLWARPLALTA
ncbi:MAG: SUMF1/EgtB/PvdO family nonheme iron enzyme [Treponema sp.]|nr:SUMF1/EgtB/PvdO family nonheme iron enzyme [Treponema sp.]